MYKWIDKKRWLLLVILASFLTMTAGELWPIGREAIGGVGTYSSNDVTVLAKMIHGEARGEPYIGKVAVGAVILNRVKDKKFPD